MAGSNSPLVCRTAEVLAVIGPVIERLDTARAEALEAREWQTTYESESNEAFGNTRAARTPLLGGHAWLAAVSGRDVAGITRALSGEWLTLATADALVQACGLTHAFHDGRIHTVPNPQWSPERWARWQQACGEDTEG